MNIEQHIRDLECKYNIKHTHELTPEYVRKILDIENEDKKSDSQRKMTWFALICMLIYPFFVVLSDLFQLDIASHIIGEMSSIYFIAVSGIVMAFFGVNAYTKVKTLKDLKNTNDREFNSNCEDKNEN